MNNESDPFQGPGPEAVYRQRLDQGVFEIQRCSACGRCQFYPRVLCRFCASPAFAWIAPQGPASVYSTTVVRRKAEDGGDYNVAVVELAEGPRMMSRVEDIGPHAVQIGMRVTPCVRRQGESAILVFVPFAAEVAA